MARKRRNAEAVEDQNEQSEGVEQTRPDVQWVPNCNPQLGPRPGCPVASLFSTALQLLVAHVDAGLLSVLETTPNLQELAVPSASKLTGVILAELPRLTPQLTCLDLSNCRGLPGAALAGLLQELTGLQRLVLDGIPEESDVMKHVDAAVLAAAGSCPSLEALSLAMCLGVDDAGLTGLAALSRPSHGGSSSSAGGRRGGVKELILDECSAVSDAGLLAIAGTLEVLSVNTVNGVTSRTIQALSRCCREVLRELDVSFCRDISEGALGQLVDQCSGSLRKLKVYGCSQLTARFLHGHSNDHLVIEGVNTSCLS
eukprot:gene13890-14009_t